MTRDCYQVIDGIVNMTGVEDLGTSLAPDGRKISGIPSASKTRHQQDASSSAVTGGRETSRSQVAKHEFMDKMIVGRFIESRSWRNAETLHRGRDN